MDANAWIQLAVTYGPMVIVVPLLIKLHWDMVYKVIPRSIRALEKSAVRDRNLLRRAIEELAEVTVMCSHCARHKRAAPPRRRGPDRRPKKSK